MSSLQLEIQRSHSRLAAATTTIYDQINVLVTNATNPQVELVNHHSMVSLISSADRQTSRNFLHPRPLPTTLVQSTCLPVWVTRTAVLLHESRGKLQAEMIAIRDIDFCKLLVQEQASVASKPLRLRLLIWLLKRESHVVGTQMQTLSKRLA
jgi:hypothetical protein